MILAIHQPDFLPWIGFFNKIQLCDLFVLGDSVQFRNKGWTNRNKIKTAQGENWLTVPLVKEFGKPINQIKINNQEQNGKIWSESHLRTLQVSYGKSEFFDDYIGYFEKIYKKHFDLLAECNTEFLKVCFEILGIKVQMKKLSELHLQSNSTQLIADICKQVNSDAYLSGIGGINYMDTELFHKNNIKLLFTNYQHPTYKQRFMDQGFLPNMSIIDLILNEGPNSLEIIKSGFKGFEIADNA